MGRIQLEAVGLEFEETGNTIWVQGMHGTLLRIKCSGQIKVKRCAAPGAHADVLVAGDIEVCVPAGVRVPAVRGEVRRTGRVSTGSGVVQAVGRRAGAVPAAQTAVRGAGRSPVSGGSGQTVGRRAVRGVRSGGRGRS
jgi:hypothetical protein